MPSVFAVDQTGGLPKRAATAPRVVRIADRGSKMRTPREPFTDDPRRDTDIRFSLCAVDQGRHLNGIYGSNASGPLFVAGQTVALASLMALRFGLRLLPEMLPTQLSRHRQVPPPFAACCCPWGGGPFQGGGRQRWSSPPGISRTPGRFRA